MTGAYEKALFAGGFGALEIAATVLPLLIFVIVVYAVAKRAVTSRLPGYGFDAERVSDEEVEVTMTGAGTASVIRFVVDGEVRGEIDAEPGASAVVEVAEGEEITARKVGGN
jgi:hypothetical protein